MIGQKRRRPKRKCRWDGGVEIRRASDMPERQCKNIARWDRRGGKWCIEDFRCKKVSCEYYEPCPHANDYTLTL